MKSAGIVSLGTYTPAKPVRADVADRLVSYLSRIGLPVEYIEPIRTQKVYPGSIETNEAGWINQPWYAEFLNRLPPQKREDPFPGIKERRRVPLDPSSVRRSIHPHPMLASDAETIAGASALVNGNFDPASIDLVLCHSQSPDLSLPANASLLQHKLQLPRAGAYAVDTCCSSFVTMIELAETLVRAGVKKRVLVVSSFLASHVIDRSEYYSIPLGDAAVAAVVSEVADEQGYQGSHSTSDGSVHKAIVYERRPPSMLLQAGLGAAYEQEFVTFRDHAACKKIATNTCKEMNRMVSGLLEKTKHTIDDLDFFVTHQPVAWAGRAWCEELGIPLQKFHESYERYGNIATCSSGVNLFEAIEQGRITAGQLVLIASSGAGENHIGVLERIAPELIRAVPRV